MRALLETARQPGQQGRGGGGRVASAALHPLDAALGEACGELGDRYVVRGAPGGAVEDPLHQGPAVPPRRLSPTLLILRSGRGATGTTGRTPCDDRPYARPDPLTGTSPRRVFVAGHTTDGRASPLRRFSAGSPPLPPRAAFLGHGHRGGGRAAVLPCCTGSPADEVTPAPRRTVRAGCGGRAATATSSTGTARSAREAGARGPTSRSP